ncbi:FKBP-type peptidyl-prolyl cis-trans isomerase [Dactylosporangium sp. NPDC005555]|uniref:FKBP-type peptidyl-prolyl cis-trans isomerase n=1 Tax=Dactylosporangium sp. NPDC005555 TaxID=3154889 RepID=UPI0033A6A943
MTERVATSQRGAANKRAASTQLDKAEKRAAAKAARAKAAAAEKRKRMLGIVGSALAVLLIIVGIAWYARSGDPSTPAAGTNSEASAPGADTPSQVAAFPPLPVDADPALGTKPTPTAGTGTVSKLVVTTLIEGKGPAAKSGQTVTVNYVGVTYADGKEFDSSWKRSQPLEFQLDTGGVIPGWDQGLQGVKIGSRVQLDIPASLAYGDNPGNGAPGGTLRFVVDMLGAK